MCVVGTVVLSKMLSCSLLEKDVKDDVSIERYLSSKSEIGHRKSSQSSSWMRCIELLVELEKDIPGIDSIVLGLPYFSI